MAEETVGTAGAAGRSGDAIIEGQSFGAIARRTSGRACVRGTTDIASDGETNEEGDEKGLREFVTHRDGQRMMGRVDEMRMAKGRK